MFHTTHMNYFVDLYTPSLLFEADSFLIHMRK